MKTANLNLLNDDYAAPRAASVELINEGALLAGSEPKSYKNEAVDLMGFDEESTPTVPDYGDEISY